MNRLIFVSALCLTCALFHCETPRVADNSSSETTNGAVVSGIVRDSTGLGVPNARVWLSRGDSSKTYIFTAADCTYSDNAGAFRFDNVISGTYFVSARKQRQISTSTTFSISSEKEVELPPDTVRDECTVSAVFATGNNFPLALRLHDSPFLAIPDQNGFVRLNGVAPGVYRFEALALDIDNGPWAAIIERGRIELAPGDSIHLGELSTRLFVDGNNTVLLDDFEDGDGRHVNGYGWWGYNEGGESSTIVHEDFAYLLPDSTRCAFLKYTFGNRRPAYCGIGVHLGYRRGEHISRAYDFSKLRTVAFRAKGTAHRVSFELISHIDQKLAISVGTLQPSWTSYRIDLDSAVASKNPDAREAWTRTAPFVSWFTFHLTQGDGPVNGEFHVDDIIFEFEN